MKKKSLEEEIHNLNIKRVRLLKQQIKMQEKQIKSERRKHQKQTFRNIVQKMAAKPVSKEAFAEKAFGNNYLKGMLGRK